MAHAITLDDKYALSEGQVFLSGTQALVRLPLVQIRRDRAAGLSTGGFISGYRGSPLGSYDSELWRARRFLDDHGVVFQPGVNEETAATAVWGTQHVGLHPGALREGVFGIWYGKVPGLDRAMDAIKHGNAAGTSPKGGVLAIVGDDHGAKSSTLAHQSEHNLMAAFLPFLYPSGVQEFVEYGLLGIAMSRFSGCWVGMKTTSDTAETSRTVDLAGEARSIIIPPFDFPAGGPHIRLGDIWREEDFRLQRYKGFAALAFARANGIDRVIFDSPRPRLGIVTTGKSFTDVMEALDELGIDAAVARDIGLKVYKVGMPWPLEPDGVRAFCEGLEEVLVVEEKREFIEHQLKWQLYNWDEKVRPRVVGKRDEHGEWLLAPDNEQTPGQVAHVIATRIARFHATERIRAKLAYFEARAAGRRNYAPPAVRKPYFCSGCPHNSSTKVPDGSRALAGIGCHIMALWMNRSTDTFTQMGGEGLTWVGEAPFTSEKHLFVNLGDGTYFHSGLLAIRQAVAAGVNMTYKVLFNDAVAMTGGQPVDGQLTVPALAAQLAAEGLARVVVVTEDVERHTAGNLPAGVTVHPRSELTTIQTDLREVPGVTAIIYDQTCAAEKRRRRKRGTMPDPDTRVFINTAVCEGCGDCSVQSNCVSIEPVETELGRKRMINQSTCNKDYSCLNGFCPAFVTLEGASLRKPALPERALDADVPMPVVPALGTDWNILVTGIGGTGVLTISALLGMAAHLDGKACALADMAGLAQKGGAVISQVRLGATADALLSPRIMSGGADLLLACDAVVAAGPLAQDLMDGARTGAIVNVDTVPTADFVLARDFDFRTSEVASVIRASANPDRSAFIPVQSVATAILGDSIATNMAVLGFAWQQGLIPLPLEALQQAIRLNDVSVAFNLRALALGRLMAHDPDAAAGLARAGLPAPPDPPAASLDEAIARRASDLAAYQNDAYAQRYRALVDRVRAAEGAVQPGSTALTSAVARALYKLMAIKDEYEVARLFTDGRFEQALRSQFGTTGRIGYHLAPQGIARLDPATGRPAKQRFGGWMKAGFHVLAAAKGLRGTRIDPFGHTEERRMERQLLANYEALLERMLTGLTPANLDLAIALATVPDQIRGFGPVKAASIAKAKAEEARLLAAWPYALTENPPSRKQ